MRLRTCRACRPLSKGESTISRPNGDLKRRSSAGWTAGKRLRSGAERTSEQFLDSRAAVVFQRSCASAGEVRMGNLRRLRRAPALPLGAGPRKPHAFFLIEHEERLIAQFREFGAPPGATLWRAVVERSADDVDLLAIVHLIPDRLKNSANGGRVGEPAVHQP